MLRWYSAVRFIYSFYFRHPEKFSQMQLNFEVYEAVSVDLRTCVL